MSECGKSAYFSKYARRAEVLGGRKPANKKESLGSPDAHRADMKAHGPGTGETFTPAARQARTILNPGSLTHGVPASLTSATFLPSESILSSAEAADFSREFSLTNISFFSPSLLSRTPVTRVSSQATTSHSASVSLARSEISARLPIGVATT